MSEEMVWSKVCFSRGRLKGPGMKLRAMGSERAGDCTGCRGPRSYLGGWYWDLHRRTLGDGRACEGWKTAYLFPGRCWAFNAVFLSLKDLSMASSGFVDDDPMEVDSRSARPAWAAGDEVANARHDQVRGSLEAEDDMYRAIRGPSRSADIAA